MYEDLPPELICLLGTLPRANVGTSVAKPEKEESRREIVALSANENTMVSRNVDTTRCECILPQYC